jgi:hypothetical protein
MSLGLVSSDRNFSNLYVNGILALRSGSIQQNSLATERPVVINLPLETEYLLVPPSNANTVVYTLSGPLGDLDQFIDIDNSNSFEGQEMIWMFENTSENSAFINISAEKFISQRSIIVVAGYKNAQYWMNTGNGWEFTVENC